MLSKKNLNSFLSVSSKPTPVSFDSFHKLPIPYACFRIMLDASGHEKDCRLVDANAAFFNSLGFRQVALGQPVREVLPDYDSLCREYFLAVMTNGRPLDIEGFIKIADHYYQASVFRVGPEFCGVLFHDMTRCQQAEQKLDGLVTRFSNIVETTTDMIYRLDLDMVITYASPSVSVIGYTPEEMVGKKCFDFVPPEDVAAVKEARKRVFNGEKITGVITRAAHKDGRVVITEASAVPIYENGRIVGEQGVLRDVTRRRAAERQASQAIEQFMTIAQISIDVIYRLDTQGRVTFISAGLKSWGYEPEEVTGRAYAEFVHPDDVASAAAAVGRVLSGEPAVSLVVRLRHKSGHYLTGEANIAPVVDGGLIVGVQGIARDISERQRIEITLKQRTEELERERQNLQIMFHSTQVGMVLLDSTGIVRRINQVAAGLVNKQPLEFLGQRIGEGLCCIHMPAGADCGDGPACPDCPIRRIFLNVLENGRPVPPTEINRRFLVDGREIETWVEVTAARVDSGNEPNVIFSIANVTGRKKTEQALLDEEKKLEDVIQALPNPLFYQDSEAVIRKCNQAFLEMCGRSLDEVVGQKMELVLSPELGFVNEPLKDTMITREARLRWGGRSDNLRDVMICEKTVSRTGGSLSGRITTIIDITERKEAENRVRDNERRLNQFFNAVPVPLYLKNTEGRYIYCNQVYADFHGKKPSDIIGKTLFDFVAADVAEMLSRKDVEVFNKGLSQHFEMTYRGRDGVLKECIAFKSPHYDGSGRIIGLIGTFLDITERKLFEQELKRREKEIEDALLELQKAHEELQRAQQMTVRAEKLAAIGLLAAGVAHEINNPLAFIGSNLVTLEGYLDDIASYLKEHQALADDEKSASIKEILSDLRPILKETREGFHRIKKIVDDLKTFSRNDKGEIGPVDLHAVIEDVLRIVWNEIRYKISLHKEYGDISPVSGNALQLGQVFINIIMNAAQAVIEQGEIAIRTYKEGGMVVVEISDSGRGMTQEVMGKIFDPFFTTKEPGKGTGLGLSVSYDIIKGHGGSIEVDSKVGQGSRFKISLPEISA